MSYMIEISKDCQKYLFKLDKKQRQLIQNWITQHLQGCLNPRQYGKKLVGELKDYWAYRIGNYRIVCLIDDENQAVQIIGIGHRSDIYLKMVHEEEMIYGIEKEAI
ncbi:MAG: type II toxin-antitoxin system RelE family toxin [Longibaculum sp.]